MKLEKVAVLGAGAVGAYVLWGLSEKPGIRLGVVAEGERARRLKNGIGINGKVYHPEVWTPEEAHGADLLIVALKYGALPGALDSIRQVVGEHTIVMSLMNGVDSEEILAAEVGADHLLYSLIKVPPTRRRTASALTRTPHWASFTASWPHPLKVSGYRPSRPCLRARAFVSAPPSTSGRRCGANSGSTSATTCPRPFWEPVWAATATAST